MPTHLLSQKSCTTVIVFSQKSMSNILEQLVQQIAYMFYDREKTMVLIGLLEIGRQVNQDELSSILKLRKTDLGKVLGVLFQDRLIAKEVKEDLTGVEDYDSLTNTEKKKLMKDYYSLDFKSFVDSVNLKIRIARNNLKMKCGKEDNIFYICPNCKKEKYSLSDLVSLSDISQGLFCPECGTTLNVIDDSDDTNKHEKEYKDFCKLTDPILSLIDQLKGLVMIDDIEDRCKSDCMITSEEYNEKKERIEKEITNRRLINSKRTANYIQNTKRENIKVDIHAQEDVERRGASKDVINFSKILEEQKTIENQNTADMPKETINIYGKQYTADEITDELMDQINDNGDDDLYNKVLEFKEK